MLTVLVACVTAAALVHATDVASRIHQTSDSAQSFVAAHAVLGGNVLLTGWRVPVDNYFATDTLPYVALEWLLGPRPFLLVLVPALTYALLVLAAALGCALATQSFPRKVEGILVVAFLLACPVWSGNWNPLLLSDFHVGSTLAALLALALCALVVAREGSGRTPLLSGFVLFLLTAVTVASDPLTLVFAFGPALFVLLVDLGLRKHSSPFGLAIVTVGVAVGLLLPLIVASVGHGLIVVNRLELGFGALSRMPASALALLFSFLNYFGANVVERQAGGGLLLGVRLIAFFAVVLAIGDVARRMVRAQEVQPLDGFLCSGILCLSIACILSAKFARPITFATIWSGSDSERYVVPAVFFSVALAGRRLPPLVASLSNNLARHAARVLLVVLALLSAAAGDWPSRLTEAQPRWIENNSAREVGQWLVRHGLRQGVGEYWSTNLINAMSGDTVAIRSVSPFHGKLFPYLWETDRRAYDQVPEFVIWQEPNQARMTYKDVVASYPVSARITLSDYFIAIVSGPSALPGVRGANDARR